LKETENKKPGENFRTYLQYSSLAFEMMGIILLFTFGGYKLDHYLHMEKQVFTVAGAITGLALAVFYLVRKLLKNR